jgi:hypothetical protein
MKYNSLYPSEITYTSDKNFDVRLKVLIEKKMREDGYETMSSKFNEFIGFFGYAEDYLFDKRIANPPSDQFTGQPDQPASSRESELVKALDEIERLKGLIEFTYKNSENFSKLSKEEKDFFWNNYQLKHNL